jgi:hypothetical protein
MAGVFDSSSARREKRGSLSWISLWLLPGGRWRAAEKKPKAMDCFFLFLCQGSFCKVEGLTFYF